MTDSRDIQFKSNFLEAVAHGEYESLDAELPSVMNLLEHDNQGNTALHYCAVHSYFATLQKILECAHPAVGLLVVYKNRNNMTALDLLLQNSILSEMNLEFILEKMQSRSLSNVFCEMLESSLKRTENPDYSYNKILKSSVEKLYQDLKQEILTKHNLTYTPTYYPREVAAPVASLGSESMLDRRVKISSRK